MAQKLDREFKKGKKLAYLPLQNICIEGTSFSGEGIEDVETEPKNTPKKYCEVVKKVKKENITPQNIGEIVLSQIPGISSITSIAIMNHFSSFSDFMEKVSSDPNVLKNLSYQDSSGKTRKISSTILKNIETYLWNKDKY
jgi:ERCC4-type nuclease